MILNTDNLKAFFEKIKSLTFWKRIFSWNTIKVLSYEAYDEFRKLSDTIGELEIHIKEKEVRISDQGNEIKILTAKVSDLQTGSLKLEGRISALENELKRITTEKNDLANTVARHEQSEKTRLDDYNKNISNINTIKAGLEGERQKLHDEKLREKEESFARMKQTWQNHENDVKERIKKICLSKEVEYVEKVPFRGNPDNTIMIADEYVIFDAKSPAGDDLENFPKYIKLQTEQVKKYIKQDNVRSDLFLVVPANTLEILSQYYFNMAEYNVYVITIDSLDPIISFLKKIEEYSFVNQLSPEERDNICRIIGRFTHTAKRKIQIDSFFSLQFLDIISKSGFNLPQDISRKVEEYEKAEKLNPPQEKRSKQIAIDELLGDAEKLALKAGNSLESGEDEESRK
jgi:hypothetical protein